ncbi:hypothetical protein FSP39_003346, partial [Pinctada imbricata]
KYMCSVYISQVKPRSSDDYIPATPIPDTIVINLGESMQRWTADKLVAGKEEDYANYNVSVYVIYFQKHRVQVPAEEVKSTKGRQSIAFFVHADDHVMLECIDKSNKYEPISSIDFISKKFSQIY